MTEQEKHPEQPILREDSARSWWLIFLLLSLWVFGIRTGCLTFILSDAYMALMPPIDFERLTLMNEPAYVSWMEHIVKMTGIFLYPIQILGVAAVPALLAKMGVFNNDKLEKYVFAGLLAFSVALMPLFLLIRGMIQHAGLFFSLLALLILCPSVALGIAYRRGAMYWQKEKAALYVGLAFLMDHVFSRFEYYSWIATENPAVYLSYTYIFFAGALAVAAVIRLRLRGESAPALPPETHAYPPRFPRNICALIAAHSLFSSAINTVIYFDNMDDFHTPGYELFFYILAFFVILAAVMLYHRRRWLAPTLIGLLLVCFGQGLSLFGIADMRLAITYNLVTMAGKVPPLLMAMLVPVYYAISERKPGLACLGFAIPGAADFLLQLTQLSEGGIGGVLPGHSRQGLLLFLGLIIIGTLFYMYTKFERARTDALLKGIQSSHKERKGMRETVDSLDLTAREKEVAALILAGDSQKMIAAKLKVSFSTVSFHVRNLYRKLNIQSKGELFALFLAAEPTDAN